ncbi:hypothetical protein LguiA_026658 [Lonicera macranthoides]
MGCLALYCYSGPLSFIIYAQTNFFSHTSSFRKKKEKKDQPSSMYYNHFLQTAL